MSASMSPDAIKKLVTFMIALALIATIITLAMYFIVIAPDQVAGQIAPLNSGCHNAYCHHP